MNQQQKNYVKFIATALAIFVLINFIDAIHNIYFLEPDGKGTQPGDPIFTCRGWRYGYRECDLGQFLSGFMGTRLVLVTFISIFLTGIIFIIKNYIKQKKK